jgi:hypothetical protein
MRVSADSHDNFFRTYDPATGRYLEADPIGQPASLHRYVYAEANPVGYIDENGLFAGKLLLALYARASGKITVQEGLFSGAGLDEAYSLIQSIDRLRRPASSCDCPSSPARALAAGAGFANDVSSLVVVAITESSMTAGLNVPTSVAAETGLAFGLSLGFWLNDTYACVTGQTIGDWMFERFYGE